MTLLRWYHPGLVRAAALLVAIAIALATGDSSVLAGDDFGGEFDG